MSTQADVTPVVGSRPRPPRTSETAFFWDGVDDHELRIQRCDACGALHHPPKAACPACASLQLGYVVASGRGVIHTHTTHHHPPVPGLQAPFNVVLVALDEGVRIVSNLIGPDAEEIAIGLTVRVVFEEVEPGLTLPLFTPDDEERR